MKSRSLLRIAALSALALLPVAAEGTSYVMMEDANLHRQADVVVRAEILQISPAPVFGMPSTDYIVLIERLLKGEVSGSTIVVRVPGGERADGLAVHIEGTPSFERGDRALLFLVPRNDGTYGILHLMLGAFVERPRGVNAVAVRRLQGAIELAGAKSSQRLVRDFSRFEEWLEDRSRGLEREADYFLPEEKTSESTEFSNLIKFRGEPIRWFEFDEGKKVTWLVGRGSKKAKRAFRQAAAAWTKDPDTCVELRAKGRTKATSGGTVSDGINAIIFDDPNSSIPGTFSCDEGGVIAAATVFYFRNPPLVRKVPKDKGKGRANVAIEADIVTNDGAACLLSGKLKASQQVFGHELGHTLGIDHACGDEDSGACSTSAKTEALMRATFHEDGRGALLSSWDRKWLDKLY